MPEPVSPTMMGDQGDDAGDNAGAGDQSQDQSGNQGQGADDQQIAGAGAEAGADDQGAGEGSDAGAGEGGEGAGQEVLYDLPDGRKVDAATLAKEFSENFMPDYTKKSQILGAAEKAGIDLSKINSDQGQGDTKPQPKWKDPDWVPSGPQELVQATMEAMQEQALQSKAADDKVRQEAADAVQAQLGEVQTELTKGDPKAKLDETALFLHANKYKFTDLVAAFHNMQDMKKVVTTTEKRVQDNLKNREADPVAGRPGAGAADEGLDYGQVSSSGNVFEAVASYLERTGKK